MRFTALPLLLAACGEQATAPDAAVLCVRAALGCPNLHFVDQPAATTSAGAFAIVAGRFDADAYPDIAVASRDASVALSGAVDVLTGTGDGAFVTRTTQPIPRLFSIAASDLDGDGDDDLVALARGQTGYATVLVFRNNGDATFASPTSMHLALTVGGHVTLADLNGDNHPDVLVTGSGPVSPAGSTGPAWKIAFNNGDGTFGAFIELSFGMFSNLAVGDLNGDGVVDVAYADPFFQTIGVFPSHAGVAMGSGAGAFPVNSMVLPTSTIGFTSIAIADVIADCSPDLVITQTDGAVILLAGRGDGTFAEPTYASVARGPRLVALRDLDGDGEADLTVLGASVQGDTTGVQFTHLDGTPMRVPPVPAATTAVLTDVDGDGLSDLVVTEGASVHAKLASCVP